MVANKPLMVMPKEKKEERNREALINLTGALAPMFYISKIVGLAIVTVQKSVDKKIEIFTSKRDYVLFGGYMTTYLFFVVVSFFTMSKENLKHAVIPPIVVLLQAILIVFIMLLTMIVTFVMRGSIVKCINRLAAIDETLNSVNIEVDYKSNKELSFIQIMLFLSLLFLRTSLAFVVFELSVVQQITINIIGPLIKSLTKHKFISLTMILSKRYEKINATLSTFTDDKTKFATMSFDDKDAKNITELMYVLCKLHYKLCSVARIFNRCYALQLLLSLGMSLFNILFESYILYGTVASKFNSETPFFIASTIFGLADEVLEVYWLVYACARTGDAANNTSIILHELRNNLKNTELENHVQMYSLQMLHQKLEFSALGFFVIDYTLVYSIIGAVTTYLVIFIQFHHGDDEEEMTTTENSINMISTSPLLPITPVN